MFDLSVLHAVDIAFGGHLAKCYAAIDPDGQTGIISKYLQRPSEQQIYRGEKDTPRDLIRAVVNLRKEMVKAPNGVDAFNQAKLPLTSYFRVPGFNSADPSHITPVLNDIAWSQDQLQAYQISVGKMMLEYQVMLVASDKRTLDAMAMAIYFYTANKKEGQHRFGVTYNIQGEEVDVKCIVDDPTVFSSTPMSSMEDGGRIFALSINYSVLTPVLYGKQVSVSESIGFQLGTDYRI